MNDHILPKDDYREPPIVDFTEEQLESAERKIREETYVWRRDPMEMLAERSARVCWLPTPEELAEFFVIKNSHFLQTLDGFEMRMDDPKYLKAGYVAVMNKPMNMSFTIDKENGATGMIERFVVNDARTFNGNAMMIRIDPEKNTEGPAEEMHIEWLGEKFERARDEEYFHKIDKAQTAYEETMQQMTMYTNIEFGSVIDFSRSELEAALDAVNRRLAERGDTMRFIAEVGHRLRDGDDREQNAMLYVLQKSRWKVNDRVPDTPDLKLLLEKAGEDHGKPMEYNCTVGYEAAKRGDDTFYSMNYSEDIRKGEAILQYVSWKDGAADHVQAEYISDEWYLANKAVEEELDTARD